MTIDEAIEHEKELAKEIYVEAMLCHANPDDGKLDDCIERGKYHEQLAERLEELKEIKSNGRYVQGNKAGQKIGYRNAIDDYNKELKEYLRRFNVHYVSDADFDYVAEQLKSGRSDE